MPINKNALLRYQILDRCFSDRHRRYEIEDLVDKVNDALLDLYGKTVSLRQIRADITYMRDRVSYNAPIVARPIEGRRCYYTYEDPHFSIFSSELSVEEVKNLLSTIDMLGRYRSPKNAWLEEVISSLELRFEQTMVIYPHYMKQYNSRWFLFGLEDHAEYGMSPVNKALDRIVKFSIANVRFVENDQIDYETYFDDIVGVTHDRKHPEVEHVVLKFAKERFPYVVSKPIHQSQQVVNAEDGTLSIDVRINRELEQNIFSFGQQVEVLSPEWFRNQIIEKYKEIVKIYGV